MKGLTPLEDVEEVLNIKLHNEEYETLNGFLVYRLDKVPEEDEHSEIQEDVYKRQTFCNDNFTFIRGKFIYDNF